eukprot:comp12275_c0_seq1/m.7097 comp12275_c0_seq1/g.7097  ORF comp12275_c0_seq1/g.7097 comp12275_c0_seq1/m.7097 type:complete len:130 (-) comp12275_c0_seq1:342-731(-)
MQHHALAVRSVRLSLFRFSQQTPPPAANLPLSVSTRFLNSTAHRYRPLEAPPGVPKEDFDPKDLCCMSGCANCVLLDLQVDNSGEPGHGENIDPSVKAFMDMERKMKEKESQVKKEKEEAKKGKKEEGR